MTRNALLREIRELQDRVLKTAYPHTPRQQAAHTRACNCLRRARRQLAAMDAGRPPRHWVDIPLDCDPCQPSQFLE